MKARTIVLKALVLTAALSAEALRPPHQKLQLQAASLQQRPLQLLRRATRAPASRLQISPVADPEDVEDPEKVLREPKDVVVDAEAPRPSLKTPIINLAKNIICGGFLSLPAGVAAIARFPTTATLLPASALLLLMGALSAYCFGLIGRTCALMRAPTYDLAWRRAIGPRSGKLVSASLTAKTAVTCLSYSMILADMASQLTGASRTRALLGVTLSGLLPLCALDTSKTFGLLKYSSALGLAATAFVTFVIGFRLLGGAYAPGGAFFAPAAAHALGVGGAAGGAAPLFGGLGVGALVLVSMLATAFMAHYNAPAFMREASGVRVLDADETAAAAQAETAAAYAAALAGESGTLAPVGVGVAEVGGDGGGVLSSLTDRGLARFDVLIRAAFVVSALTFLAVAAAGFLTFGSGCAGNVLSNYALADPLAKYARAALGVSLLAGYPLAFASLKSSVLTAVDAVRTTAARPVVRDGGVGGGRRARLGARLLDTALSPLGVSIALLSLITAAAAALTDLGLVSSVAGAILGSAIIYVYPAIMYRAALRRAGLLKAKPLQAASSIAIAAAGVALMGLGGWASLTKGGAH